MDITPDEITPEELAEIRALRTAREVAPPEVIEIDGTPVAVEDKPEEDDEPWPHATIDFADEKLEVRKPSSQALIAFSIASGGVDPMIQMRVFRMFLQKHLSPKSFQSVLVNMLDPENTEYSLEALLKALVALPD